jgi:hypothetical protein
VVREELREKNRGVLRGTSATSIGDGAGHQSDDRSVFELPGNPVLVDKANVPELYESFVMKVSELKVAHRDDDGGWMTGSNKKHKLTKRTDSTGKTTSLR